MINITKLWSLRRFIIGWFTPFFWSPILFTYQSQESKCAYIVLVMITYWFTEVIPMAVTALLPVVLFPLFGIVSSDIIVQPYVNGTIMILLGSLIAATAVEKSNLHERIALRVILFTGTSPKRLLIGFMSTTAFLSMLVSNVASVALMVPIVNAALEQLTRRQSVSCDHRNPPEIRLSLETKMHGNEAGTGTSPSPNNSTESDRKEIRKLKNGIYLGVCYASNIGGTGTLTGTPTNLIMNAFLKNHAISYSDWFFINFPGMAFLIFLTWVFLCVFFVNTNKTSKENQKQVYRSIENQYQKLGSLTFHEIAVLVLFVLLVLLWFFRAPDFMTGWFNLFMDDPQFIKDSMPTILVVVLFFLIPSDIKNLENSPMLLDWKSTQEKISWSVILLLAGGFAMAKGCEDSGLSQLIGTKLMVMQNLPHIVITAILCSVSLIMTELISNAATCNVLIPVIYQMSSTMGINPLSIILPVTVCCSYAFMLPFASGPTAIVYEVSGMKNKEMIIPGIFVKILCLVGLLFVNYTWADFVYDTSTPFVDSQAAVSQI